MSDWFNRNGSNAHDYYYKMILFFVVHGILFENFLIYGQESQFTKNIFLPAYKKVVETTGLKPLIVPIPPMDEEYDKYITYHQPLVKQIINKK